MVVREPCRALRDAKAWLPLGFLCPLPREVADQVAGGLLEHGTVEAMAGTVDEVQTSVVVDRGRPLRVAWVYQLVCRAVGDEHGSLVGANLRVGVDVPAVPLFSATVDAATSSVSAAKSGRARSPTMRPFSDSITCSTTCTAPPWLRLFCHSCYSLSPFIDNASTSDIKD